MNTSFLDILSLAKKTGDVVIVTDTEGREPMVILPFEQYQKCIDGKTSVNDVVQTKVASETQSQTVLNSAIVQVKENLEKPPELPPVAEEQFYLEPVE